MGMIQIGCIISQEISMKNVARYYWIYIGQMTRLVLTGSIERLGIRTQRSEQIGLHYRFLHISLLSNSLLRNQISIMEKKAMSSSQKTSRQKQAAQQTSPPSGPEHETTAKHYNGQAKSVYHWRSLRQ